MYHSRPELNRAVWSEITNNNVTVILQRLQKVAFIIAAYSPKVFSRFRLHAFSSHFHDHNLTEYTNASDMAANIVTEHCWEIMGDNP